MEAITAELGNDEYLPLAEALRRLRADKKTRWLPVHRLREAVRNGEVPSKRTREGRYARYYVRIADLLKVVK